MPSRAVVPPCPWCGEPFEVSADEGGARRQRYVEDCAVCCHPCVVTVELRDGDEPLVSIERE